MERLIQIEDNGIAQDLLTQGFHALDNSKFCINTKLHNDTIKFIEAYNNLEIDKYVLEKEQKPYRKRRYGSFILDTQDLSLSINEHKTFFQSQKVNKAYGGITRDFAPITQEIMTNNFLQEIIKADFQTLPKSDKQKSKKWFIGVQMFRIEATKDYAGEPSPEGIHQDEHYFVLQHMINKYNVKGGRSTIFDLDKKEIVSLTLIILWIVVL